MKLTIEGSKKQGEKIITITGIKREGRTKANIKFKGIWVGDEFLKKVDKLYKIVDLIFNAEHKEEKNDDGIIN